MNLAFVSIVFILFSSVPAKAYVDPGTASIALQALVGGIAAFGLFFRSKIRTIFSKLRSKDRQINGKTEDSPTAKNLAVSAEDNEGNPKKKDKT
ncbi:MULTISPECIES: hypothetical protein [Thalassospira]|uniref:hypothetical protein n=1 Tax=Thalassospira TaxID=168934 RepID=UPI0007A5ECC8|nr:MULTISPECIES: hypothetical protein [unclassified Thalassospira]KZD00778.1 hypothetical protein AUQ41_05235 [Thalassospira sp. MCCC 1A02898]ONH88325.1 hypothetical protein TH47_07780 [Thalassospira sp. MCCC 1A02803]BDW89404.1 hypothetical protein MACH01_21710 [Thalassospira tepidiphila]